MVVGRDNFVANVVGDADARQTACSVAERGNLVANVVGGADAVPRARTALGFAGQPSPLASPSMVLADGCSVVVRAGTAPRGIALGHAGPGPAGIPEGGIAAVVAQAALLVK